jgi:Protein of unknown function (DUF4230)
MDSFFNILFCLIGAAAGFGLYALYARWRGSETQLIKNESSVLLEKIEKVFKVVLAEGHFSEIYDHMSEKEVLFGLTKTNKKALIVAKAKVLVGFDFAKMQIRWHEGKRQMVVENWPEPEILAADTDYKFYDIEQGLFNRFSNEEYTQLLSDAKQTMHTKASASELPKIATRQLTVMMNQLAASMGWSIEYQLPPADQKLLAEPQNSFRDKITSADSSTHR